MRRFPVRWPGRTLRSLRSLLPAALLLLLVPALALAQANGKLQIHHIDVGQGDGMLLISPLGETALFDDGTYTNCSGIKNYLLNLGITGVRYHFETHHHSDHIGCIDDLAAIGITVTDKGYDRGGTYSSQSFTDYVNTLGSKRTTIAKNQILTLDAGAANPVYVKCVDLNGAGISSSDENTLSVVYKISYGAFDEVVGGDLTGDASYGNDVESIVGPEVGDVEVYKVHHHGSRYSSNDNWLNAITPEVGVVSVGNGNTYGHPTADALTRLHNHSVHTYWTETGAGVAPNASWDKVGGTIVIQADPGTGANFTVAGNGFTDTYTNGGGTPPVIITETVVASGLTVLKGTIASGNVTSLAANDAVRVTISAVKSGTRYTTDWYGSATLAHPPTSLTLTYDGSYSASRTQTLYLYNWSTSAWTQVNSGSVGTTDVTKTYTTTSPANFVSGTGEVRARVLGALNKSSYSCRGDYMAFTYDYVQGTLTQPVTAFALTPRAAEDPVPAAAEEADIALSAAPNPLFRSTRLSFTLPHDADARLEVFDLNGRRVAVPFAGHAAPGVTSVEWTLGGADGTRVPAGIYFARFEALGRAAVTRMVVLGR